MNWGQARWLEALWLLPLIGMAGGLGLRATQRGLRALIESGLIARVAPSAGVGRRVVKLLLQVAAAGLMVVALARPQWNAQPREVEQRGRDVCFIVDVSRSMLAEDLAPSRLERAKLWIRDAAGILRGDRVALVAFAGNAVVKCPLTNDYAYFRQSVEDLSPLSVSRGGTNIGDAVRLALGEVFETDSTTKDIIVITDGEDHESFPVEAGKSAGEQGVRIIAIGLGDEGEGKPIPITDERGRRSFVMREGKPVLSRLDGAMLRTMALASAGGKYLNVGTGTIELDAVYRQFIQEAEQRTLATADRVRYDEQFQWFLAAAALLLLIDGAIGERRRVRA